VGGLEKYLSFYYTKAMHSACLRSVASPRRREILRVVWAKELPAGEIHRQVSALDPVSFAAVSQHLRQLEQAGLVEARPEGRRRWYRARPEALGALAAELEAMWDSALDRLQVLAELEASRRGPRAVGPQTA
jgi:DNA-binding transcriptional ArsR family regulator